MVKGRWGRKALKVALFPSTLGLEYELGLKIKIYFLSISVPKV